MKRLSGNQIVEKTKSVTPNTHEASIVMNIWKENLEQTVRNKGVTMDDEVFIEEPNGWTYVGKDTTKEAYERAMQGI